MFREDHSGKGGRKNDAGMHITHIEMIVDKPYIKDGKWYVKTYGSAAHPSDVMDVTDINGTPLINTDGVGYRIREITDNHHFAKPPYYEQLVAMNKKKTSKPINTRSV